MLKSSVARITGDFQESIRIMNPKNEINDVKLYSYQVFNSQINIKDLSKIAEIDKWKKPVDKYCFEKFCISACQNLRNIFARFLST